VPGRSEVSNGLAPDMVLVFNRRDTGV